MQTAPKPTSTQSKQPSIFDQARSFLQRRNPKPEEGAAQLGSANAKIVELTQQLADLTASEAKLKQTLAGIENGTVVLPASIAALGFPASGLPGVIAVPDHSLESLQALFKEETDPLKRAELAAKIIKMR